MSFVSNVPLEFAGAMQDIVFKDCDGDTFTKLLQRLQLEHKSATQEQAGLIYFVKVDLSLHYASAHANGKLNTFVVKIHSEVAHNLDGL